MSEDNRKYFCGPSYLPQWATKMFSSKFNEACRIHDVDYSTKRVTREQADATFLRNMLDKCDGFWSRAKAHLMYKLVRTFGGNRYGKK